MLKIFSKFKATLYEIKKIDDDKIEILILVVLI